MRTFVTVFMAIILMSFVNLATAQVEFQREKGRGGLRDGRSEMGSDEKPDREGTRGRGLKGRGEHSLIDRFIKNPKIVEKLGLSDEQVSQLKTVSKESKAKLKELHEAMKEAGKQQAKQITADDIDEQAVMEAVEQAGKIRTEIAKVQTRQILMLKKLLTPEQSERLKEIMGRHKRERERERGEDDGDGFRRSKDRESGKEDMERRREEMREKMTKRRQERLRELEKEGKEEDNSDL